jgi:dolichol-phosphate mannosyltransferase
VIKADSTQDLPQGAAIAPASPPLPASAHRVTLVVPVDRAALATLNGQLDSLRASLLREGCAVEAILAADASISELPDQAEGWHSTASQDRGIAAAAMHGAASSTTDWIIILDPRLGYSPADVLTLLKHLPSAESQLVIASRNQSTKQKNPIGPMNWLSEAKQALSQCAFGTTDPFSGLVAVRKSALTSAHIIHAVGSQFTFELLSKIQGDKTDLPVPRTKRAGWTRIGWHEIRHLKRLADHRFGNASRLIQFCVVGATGMVVDLSCYALFQFLFKQTSLAKIQTPLFGVPLSLTLAAATAIGIALIWNFSLNRRLTFSDAKRTQIVRQFLAYALSNALAVSVSLSLRLLLPRFVPFFADHKLAAAVTGIVVATGLSFSLARFVVFRPASTPPDRDPVTPDPI